MKLMSSKATEFIEFTQTRKKRCWTAIDCNWNVFQKKNISTSMYSCACETIMRLTGDNLTRSNQFGCLCICKLIATANSSNEIKRMRSIFDFISIFGKTNWIYFMSHCTVKVKTSFLYKKGNEFTETQK